MAAPTPGTERVRTVVYRDGLGERFIAADSVTGEVAQVLQLSPPLVGPRMFEFALRERVVRFSRFRHASFLPAHRVDRDDSPIPGLALVCAHVQGIRLSQLLRTARDRQVTVDITAALEAIRQLLPAMALVHEFAPDIACGLIGPERLIVSSVGQITVAEQALGGAIEQLRFDRDRLWREFRISVPANREHVRFSHRGDVMSLGLVALALVLGRPLDDRDFPEGLAPLLDSARERSMTSDDQPLSAPLRDWLERALQLDPDRAFTSIAEAWVVFSKVLTNETAYHATPAALSTLVYTCTVALLHPAAGETDLRPSAHHDIPPPSQPPAALDAAQDPEIHVEMLPPPSVQGHLSPLSVATGEIDWMAGSEQLTAVASSRDISELLADIDDAATRSGGPAPESARALFDEVDEMSDMVGDLATAAPDTFSDVEPGSKPSGLTARLVALAPSSRLARTVMATALLTVLTVSVVLASLRAPALRSPDPGTIVVQTSPPGLQVLVNGVEQGETPARVRVSPGDHVLEVRGVTGARLVPVTVSSGAEVSQYIEFPGTAADGEASRPPDSPAISVAPAVAADAPAPIASAPPQALPEVPAWGWIAVNGPFPVELRSGGKIVGTAGVERLRMGAGRHEIELVNDAQAYRVSRVVHIVPGKVTSITIEKPAMGTVSLNASPWAEVWIAGRRIGETPLANVSIGAGRHEVVFRHPQLGEKRQEISVAPGAAVRLAIEMK